MKLDIIYIFCAFSNSKMNSMCSQYYPFAVEYINRYIRKAKSSREVKCESV